MAMRSGLGEEKRGMSVKLRNLHSPKLAGLLPEQEQNSGRRGGLDCHSLVWRWE